MRTWFLPRHENISLKFRLSSAAITFSKATPCSWSLASSCLVTVKASHMMATKMRHSTKPWITQYMMKNVVLNSCMALENRCTLNWPSSNTWCGEGIRTKQMVQVMYVTKIKTFQNGLMNICRQYNVCPPFYNAYYALNTN